MKKIISFLFIIAFAILFCVQDIDASVRVKGNIKRKTGKFVQPHFRSSPNKTKIDNYSTKGNINPYTGKKGTKRK